MILSYLAAGSNLGNRFDSLKSAQNFLKAVPGIYFRRGSSLYETEPVGGPAGQNHYLNAVWEIETHLKPEKLLEVLLEIEKKLGRERSQRNAPRTLDLDILFYGDKIVHSKGLSIPHPRLAERAFVLQPLAELCPRKIHPESKKNVAELLKKCSDKHLVKRYEKNHQS